MVIKIPSKNIYGVENQKVRNNVIKKISCNSSYISPKNEFDVLVHSESFQPDIASIGAVFEETKGDFDYSLAAGGQNINMASYLMYKPWHIGYIYVKIPKKRKNSYVGKIYNGKNSDGKFLIKCVLEGNIYKGTASSTVNWNGGNPVRTSATERFYQNPSPHSITIDSEAKDIKYDVVDESAYDLDVSGLHIDLTQQVNEFAPNNLSGDGDYYKETEDFYEVKVSFTSSYEIIKMFGASTANEFPIGTNKGLVGNSYAEMFVCERIEISVNGDVIGIDIEEKNKEIGDGENPFTISANEINQYTNVALDEEKTAKFEIDGYDETLEGFLYYIKPISGYFLDGEFIKIILDGATTNAKIFYFNGAPHFKTTNYIGGKGNILDCYEKIPSYEKNSNDIISRYKDGKETIEILCGINDYFNEYGFKRISANGELEKMTFDIGDIVIPYKKVANGKDEPISVYKNGYSKKFEVVGVCLVYDGATMQKIIAQEAKENY